MALSIKRATKQGLKLKIIFAGLPGAGKTWTALTVGAAVAAHLGSRLVVIDTEGGQSQTYADDFDFDVIELDDHAPKSYVEALKYVVEQGYQVAIVDSFSHEWNGTNGILQTVNRERNKFSDGWGTATPLHDRFVQYLVNAPLHIIGTVRQKIVHAQDAEVDERGVKRTVIRKLGEQDQQRDTFLYELALHAALDQQHTLTVDKSRYRTVPVGLTLHEPGLDLADRLIAWMTSGEPETAEPPEPPEPQKITPLRQRGQVQNRSTESADTPASEIAGAETQQHISRLMRGIDITTLDQARKWLLEQTGRHDIDVLALRNGASTLTRLEAQQLIKVLEPAVAQQENALVGPQYTKHGL